MISLRFAILLLLPALGGWGCAGSGTGSGERPDLAIFSDQTADLGLDFVHFNGMSGEFYMPEMVGPGGALLDYDNDGDLDLFLLQGDVMGPGKTMEDALDRLYRNDLEIRPDGSRVVRFIDVTKGSGLDSGGYGMGVATGDYDNDGWVDLYVTNFGPNRMYRNRGDGTFADVTEATRTGDRRWSVPAAFLDFDRDGWLDLYVGNYVDFRFANHRECLSESGTRDYCGPQAYEPVPDRLFRNRGDGTFEDVTRRSGLRSAFGAALGAIPSDLNGDGWLDLYVANDGSSNQLWLNGTDGTFKDVALLAGCAVNESGAPEASMGVDAGDFDNDGDEDLFMSHLAQETNTVYLNDGRATFEDYSVRSGLGAPSWKYTGFGAGWIDYDNDGWLDVLVVNGAVTIIEELYLVSDPYPLHQPNQLFRNLGDGRFEEITHRAGPVFALSEVSRGTAFGDLDNDGDTDVVLVNNNGPARLLMNNVGQQGHWIGLRLVDGRSLRDMVGAWVGVFRPGLPPLWRRVRAAGSYASANDPRVVFGLGDSAAVERVRVQWPGGGVEEWEELATGTYHTLREGTGKAIR